MSGGSRCNGSVTDYPQVSREPARLLDLALADGTCPAAAAATNDPQAGALFDTGIGRLASGRVAAPVRTVRPHRDHTAARKGRRKRRFGGVDQRRLPRAARAEHLARSATDLAPQPTFRRPWRRGMTA